MIIELVIMISLVSSFQTKSKFPNYQTPRNICQKSVVFAKSRFHGKFVAEWKLFCLIENKMWGAKKEQFAIIRLDLVFAIKVQ